MVLFSLSFLTVNEECLSVGLLDRQQKTSEDSTLDSSAVLMNCSWDEHLQQIPQNCFRNTEAEGVLEGPS